VNGDGDDEGFEYYKVNQKYKQGSIYEQESIMVFTSKK